jgi:O-methyltransferase involved in polyketide biosynthesis
MRERRPSQTAAQVAVLRALADRGYTHVEGFADPVARNLLSGFWSGVLRVAERGFERLQPEVRDRIIDELDIVARRVRAIDSELERTVAEGVRQVVIASVRACDPRHASANIGTTTNPCMVSQHVTLRSWSSLLGSC